jgi:hypothetical protein
VLALPLPLLARNMRTPCHNSNPATATPATAPTTAPTTTPELAAPPLPLPLLLPVTTACGDCPLLWPLLPVLFPPPVSGESSGVIKTLEVGGAKGSWAGMSMFVS